LLVSISRAANSFSQKVDAVTKWVCIGLILVMSVEVLTAVFFRYALNAPIKWGEELARLLMVWAGLLGISIALREGEHIGLEVLTGKLKGRSLFLVNLISNATVLIFIVILLIWGINLAVQAWATFLPGLRISWTWSILAVPVTAGLQLIHLVSRVLGEIRSLASADK